MVPGRMYGLNDGSVLAFSIETSYAGGGRVSARNNGTGEAFSGTYSDASSAQSAPGTGAVPSFQGNAVATLVGDKGTVITCQIYIQGNYSRSGIGQCKDNRRGSYSVSF